jgi:GH25 family lysozyme M1 (1,4-beta-N-acetylmuramidase)/LysM repeat protein
VNGIDVSTHQGHIDWPAVKAAGIDFAIIRAGYGNDISQADARFVENITGALAAGIHVGAYWFSYAYNALMAKQEAEIFSKVLGPYKGKIVFPVCFDWEYDSDRYAQKHGVTASAALITDMAIAFLEGMEAEGWYAANYLNQDYYKNKFDATRMKPYDVWLADYSGGPAYSCGLQQTGSTGKVAGISGNVDTDTSFKDYPTIITKGGLNGYGKGSSAPTPAPAPQPAPAPSLAHKAGEQVIFSTCYSSSTDDASKAIPASKMARDHGTITKTIPGAHNPYLLDDGLCWVNDGDIRGTYNPAPQKPAAQPAAPTSGSYTVKSGDTMSGIASKNGIATQALVDANPQIKDPNMIHPGDVLKIPGKATEAAAAKEAKVGAVATIRAGAVYGGLSSARGAHVPDYVVGAKRYTIGQIAAHNGVQEALLKEINSWVALSYLTVV